MARDGAFVALAGLHFFEGMGQGAHRPGQDKQPATKRGRKAELRENDTGGAVDIHGDGPPLLRRQLRFQRAGDGSEASAHRAGAGSGVDELACVICVSLTAPSPSRAAIAL